MSPKLTNLNPEEFLESFDKFGIHLGLERIQQLLKSLGSPHQKIPVIHVAGTNGKGSVCAFLLSILQEAGYRVGRYTSPHLLDWRERITINGQWISAEDLQTALHQVQLAIDAEFPPTQFEVITAAMWWHFAQQKSQQNLDIAIIETGLGGRLDATNVCDRPLVSVITSLGLDHCQQLGNTLGAIASEKAGIIKPQCPVVIAHHDRAGYDEAIAALQTKIHETLAPIAWVKPAKRSDDGYGAVWQDLHYSLPLLGNHQLMNSAIAIATIQVLQNQGWLVTNKAIRQGMANTQWAGRLQWLEFEIDGKLHKILIDGAHNVAAAEYLRQFVDENFPDHRKHWIVGILNTKDQAGILKALLHPDDLLFSVPVPNPATTAPQELVAIAKSILPISAFVNSSLDQGVEAAFKDRQLPDQIPNMVILCGSLYLVGEFFQKYRDRFQY
ncbi:bifunctional folylpolyglutamate synthase/dihydrofolate synthase [Pseudanabaena sp. FACHB-1998]|uniref:bifunctional folylpolyglutamate synthase/dihydrofolate synthase n=1 Tax=Pseudanabaena sp. FACHB-1998 TaxID=2692858 RepID=UPI0016808560|nr:folylpolyglutamate synthase/dihydrofolate synthase family protein [Pseudanabaena sp. FACHB-1998]MBD2176608.1 bifunctional folylpolyglutamate synthase/dihydrofolate synthase [Pseudanabaena sp. FACHB-1998]